jgi:hypothetical protein
MSSKIILPIIIIIIVLLVGVGVYTSLANLNPLKESKSTSSVAQNQVSNKVKSILPTRPNPYVAPSSNKNAEVKETAMEETKAETPKENTTNRIKTFSMSDLTSNYSESSCYVSVFKKVYDVTAYIKDHPGGERNILKGCGRVLDGMKHPGGGFMGEQVQGVLADYKIGELN